MNNSESRKLQSIISRLLSDLDNPEAAYVMRLRLGRLIVRLFNMVGGTGERVLFPEDALSAESSIQTNYRQAMLDIVELSSTICQPSEPLAERWISGSKELRGLLLQLQEGLAESTSTVSKVTS